MSVTEHEELVRTAVLLRIAVALLDLAWILLLVELILTGAHPWLASGSAAVFLIAQGPVVMTYRTPRKRRAR